jgi:hypothetical protein
MVATCSSRTSVDFQLLHCVIFHKIEFFLTIVVRISEPAGKKDKVIPVTARGGP